MIWTLIIVFAFSTGGGFRNGGSGGLTSETIDFSTKEECEASGKEITDFYKGWMVKNLNLRYKCVQHTAPNKKT